MTLEGLSTKRKREVATTMWSFTVRLRLAHHQTKTKNKKTRESTVDSIIKIITSKKKKIYIHSQGLNSMEYKIENY